MADMAKALNPLRLSYTIFADRNPLMKRVEKLAASVSAAREPVAADNPFLGCTPAALMKRWSGPCFMSRRMTRCSTSNLLWH
jgi:hypothetical protein